LWESIKRNSIDIDCLEDEISTTFKTITKEEAIRLNRIKSYNFNRNLGTKFISKIDWKEFIHKTIEVLTTAESIGELENRFFALCDRFLVAIKTELKI
jgi:hypothetical protein